MRSRSALKWFFAFGFLALAAGPAGAQTIDAGAGSANTVGAPTGTSTSPSATVGFQHPRTLTVEEQVVESGKHLARIENARSGVQKQLASARAAHEVVKADCLSDKLSQIDVAIRSSRDHSADLKRAAERNNTELTSHEFTILTVLRQRTEQLVAEANQCIGSDVIFLANTTTTTSVDPSIADNEAPYPDTIAPFDPPAAAVIGPALPATPIR